MDRKQQPPPQHQVFINFRGKELRYNFISHLERALKDRAIKVFIDTDEDKGEDISNLFKRIEESKIALVVFSSMYTESRWCLDELAVIKKRLDGGMIKVLPIFYKVIPSDVKQLKGDFGNNFRDREWEYRHEKDMVEKWKNALKCITGKIGLPFDTKSSESDFIVSIVTNVLKLLEKISSTEQTANSQVNQHFQKGETSAATKNTENSIFRAPQEKSKITESRESTGFGPRGSLVANPSSLGSGLGSFRGNTLAPNPNVSGLGSAPFGQRSWPNSDSGFLGSSSTLPNANFSGLGPLPLQPRTPIISTTPHGRTTAPANGSRLGVSPVQGSYEMGQRAGSTHQPYSPVPSSPNPSWLPSNHNPQYGQGQVIYSSSTSINGRPVSNYRVVWNPSSGTTPHFSLPENFNDDSD